jgi:hypothetical protein
MNLTAHVAICLGMADEARTAAARLDDPGLRRQLFILAAKYEVLARNAKASALGAAAANCNELPRARTSC